jgi:hypothetical protein
MLDDLRNSVEKEYVEEDPLDDAVYENAGKPERTPFLGMTAGQRFVIAFFVFLMVAILGVFVLIVFQKIFPPSNLKKRRRSTSPPLVFIPRYLPARVHPQ